MSKHSSLLQRAEHVASVLAKQNTPAHDLAEKEQAIVADPAASGLALFFLASKLVGPSVLTVEPEVIVAALSRYQVPPQNYDKIAVVIAAQVRKRSPYHDWRVHCTAASVLSGELTHPDLLPSPSANELAWAAFELTLVHYAITELSQNDDHAPDFSDEVAAAVGLRLWDEGWLTTPDYLDFAKEVLETHLSPESKKEGEQARAAHDQDPLEKEDHEETPVGVQRARLAQMDHYVTTRVTMMQRELDAITP